MESRHRPSSSASDNRRIARPLFLTATLLFSVYFTQVRYSLNEEYGRATFAALLDYSAAIPFQCRILIPWLVNGLSSFLVPLSIIDSPVRLFKVIDLFSVFSLVVVFRWYVSLFLKNYTSSAILALSIFYVLPFNYLLPRINAFLYPSDIPAVAFFCLGLVLLYRQDWLRYYPLFQEAYEYLGYPSAYFNDRLIDVIDHLLATPVVDGPIRLVRPHVLYKYADPDLEALSAGRKALIRIGPDNANRVKQKLREIRQILTGQSEVEQLGEEIETEIDLILDENTESTEP